MAGLMGQALSVTIITRNESVHLEDCLRSARWADEVVVVDAESADGTADIARRFADKVIAQPWLGFAAQKNLALDHATKPWVLSLDADERVTPDLRCEIEGVLDADGPCAGYSIPRKNFFRGRWIRHGLLFPDRQLRLFRRDRGRFGRVQVHESVQVTGSVGLLRAPLLHYTYGSIEEFVDRANVYSSLAAEDLLAQGSRAAWPALLLRPLGRFCTMYLLHRGFLDGREGLLLAALYSYYVFLRTAKVWDGNRRGGPNRSGRADRHGPAPSRQEE
jgi:glycosyltransferase involved in cell wall biosynthesis